MGRKQFNKEYKVAAINLVKEEKQKISEAARQLTLSEGTLYVHNRLFLNLLHISLENKVFIWFYSDGRKAGDLSMACLRSYII